MSLDQIIIILIFVTTLIFLLTNKIRYDLTALLALVVVSFTNILSPNDLFSGFGNPAVVMVASMFIISKGLSNSGVVDTLVGFFRNITDYDRFQLGIITSLSALISGIINNTGTTAIFMPTTIAMAKNSKYNASKYLIPLAYSTLLGGTITLLGTPSNIIVATFRENAGLPETSLFEYAPLGIIITLIGLVFIWFIGWYLLPEKEGTKTGDESFDIKDYVTEVKVLGNSAYIGKEIGELEHIENIEVTVIALTRDDGEQLVLSGHEKIKENDILLIRSDSESLEEFLSETKFQLEADKGVRVDQRFTDLEIREAVVPPNSFLIGKSAKMLNLRWRYGVNLLAISHQGGGVVQRLGDIKIRAGDVLLFQGLENKLLDILKRLEVVPLKEREIKIGYSKNVIFAILILLGMIAFSLIRIAPLPVVFMGTALAFVFTRLVSLEDMYKNIDWPIIILMGAMITITQAMDEVGLFDLLSSGLLHASFSFNPTILLVSVLVGTMLLSNLLDNAVVAVIMAPIAINIATSYTVSIEPFLAAVLVGSVSAFILPFGEQPNILVMAPGKYEFKDYIRIGTIMSLLVLIVSVPSILYFWPL